MDMSILTLALIATVVQYVTTQDTTPHPYKQVCYTKLGCFDNNAPWDNALGRLPVAPEVINVTQDLYTRATRNNPEHLSYNSTTSVTFDPTKATKVVIHGWQNAATTKWVVDMKDALLNKGDFNVLVVGWGQGAKGLDYFASAANVRLVAAEVKLLLRAFVKLGLDLGDLHLIGHSLGAHMAGQIGQMLGGSIGRISGMDPAMPTFEHHDALIRLDKTDAVFVDVLHTDGNGTDITKGGYGLMQESGHVDFYVNGGVGPQPGCHNALSGLLDIIGKKRGIFDNLASQLACSHGRSHDVFLESIVSSCAFTGYSCSNWAEFQTGSCLDCSKGGCATAGYGADATASGSKYFMTNAKAPFCGNHYRIYLHLHASIPRTDGTIYVALIGTAGQTDFTMVTKHNEQLTSATVVNGVLLFDKNVGDVHTIKVKYVKDASGHAHTSDVTYIAGVHVQESQSGKRFTTCQGKFQLTSDQASDEPTYTVDQRTQSSCFDPQVWA